MAKWFRDNGDNVFFYHFFSKEQYSNVNDYIHQNSIDIALWHISGVKLKSKINIDVPLVCLFHNDPNFPFNPNIYCRNHHFNKYKKALVLSKLCVHILSTIHSLNKHFFFTYVTYKSDKMVALSSKSYPAPIFKRKTIYIPNCIETVNWCPTEKNNTVLYVGRLSYEKHIEYILQIWSKIQETVSDWNLVIAGDGPESGLYKKMAKELGVRCQWLGFVNDPSSLYEKSKIILLTSEREGFPMTLLESSAYGCIPVIFNSFPAATDFIIDEQSGILIPPFDTSLFAERLLGLMKNDNLLKKMSSAAMLNAKRFETNTIMPIWKSLFTKIITAKQKS